MYNSFKKLSLLLFFSVIILVGCRSNLEDSERITSMLINKGDIFKKENDNYYLFGLTIGESKANVIKQLGDNYEVILEPSELSTSGAPESAIQYNNGAIKILFNKGEYMIGIYIENFNSSEFEKIYNSYNGFKFEDFTNNEDKYNPNNKGFLYSKNADQVLIAKYDNKQVMYLRLMKADPNFKETLEYIKNQENNVGH